MSGTLGRGELKLSASLTGEGVGTKHPVMIHAQAAHAQRRSGHCIEFSKPHRFSRARHKDITPSGLHRTHTRLGIDFDAWPGKQPNPDVDGPLGRRKDLVQQDQDHARNPDKRQKNNQRKQPVLPPGQSSHHASSFDRLGVRISPSAAVLRCVQAYPTPGPSENPRAVLASTALIATTCQVIGTTPRARRKATLPARYTATPLPTARAGRCASGRRA